MYVPLLEYRGRWVLVSVKGSWEKIKMPSHCNLLREALQVAHTNTVSLCASGAEEETIMRR